MRPVDSYVRQLEQVRGNLYPVKMQLTDMLIDKDNLPASLVAELAQLVLAVEGLDARVKVVGLLYEPARTVPP